LPRALAGGQEIRRNSRKELGLHTGGYIEVTDFKNGATELTKRTELFSLKKTKTS
jgi:hypothetical protein